MIEFKQSRYYEEGSSAGGPTAAELDEFLASPDSVWLLKLSCHLVKLAPTRELTTWQGADWSPRYFDPGQRPDLEARASGARVPDSG